MLGIEPQRRGDNRGMSPTEVLTQMGGDDQKRVTLQEKTGETLPEGGGGGHNPESPRVIP